MTFVTEMGGSSRADPDHPPLKPNSPLYIFSRLAIVLPGSPEMRVEIHESEAAAQCEVDQRQRAVGEIYRPDDIKFVGTWTRSVSVLG